MYNEMDSKLLNANIKLQDENRELKFSLSQDKEILENIKAYIKINKDENDKVNINGILEILGENYE